MSTIYVLKEGQKRGPFSTEELGQHVEAGVFCREDLYWTEGMEEWQPLSTVIEDPPVEEAVVTAEEEIFFESKGIRVTSMTVEIEDETFAPEIIAKAEAQIETVRRVRPIVGSIVVGVVIVCLALLELPRTAIVHWVLWGAVLLGLLLWWIRLLYAALRSPRSIVVLDFLDGDERVIRIKAETAAPLAEAINQAAAAARPNLDS